MLCFVLTLKRAKGVKVAKVNQRKRFTNAIKKKKKRQLLRIRRKISELWLQYHKPIMFEGIFINNILPGALISTPKLLL